MGDYSLICELHGRAAPGKGCTNGAVYPTGLKYCSLRNERHRSSCTLSDVDALVDPNAGGGVAVLSTWLAAKAAVVAGTADTDMVTFIDSIGAGVLGPNSFVNCEVTSWPTRLAAKLTAAGVQARHWSFTGAKGVASPAEITAFDPRVTFVAGADWTVSSQDTLGGVAPRQNSPGTSRMQFTVPDVIDTVTVSLIQFAAVVVGVYVDGGVTPVGTITVTTTGGLGKYSFPVPRGVHTVEVARISGGSLFVAEIAVDDTTFKKVRIHNGGRPSYTASYGSQIGAYSVYERIKQIAPSLVILPVSVNDYSVGTTQASWNASMQLFIDASKTAGSDILPVVGQPRSTFETAMPIFAGYWQALAASNGLITPKDLSIRAGWANAAAAVSAGFLNGVHPTPTGYDDMGTAHFGWI